MQRWKTSSYLGVNRFVVDINECLNTTVCSNHTHTCVNTEPSYHCNCKEGYGHSDPSAKKKCESEWKDERGKWWRNLSDINECQRIPFPCNRNADCEDTIGSYTCTCKTGYTGQSPLVSTTFLQNISCIICIIQAMDTSIARWSILVIFPLRAKKDRNATRSRLYARYENTVNMQSPKREMHYLQLLPDKPIAVCECKDGYEPATGTYTNCNGDLSSLVLV